LGSGPPSCPYSSSFREEVFWDARYVQDALYPNPHHCRFESSATRIRCHPNAELFELHFRARLTDKASELEVALV
jgi:hypothetical protein